MKRQVLALNFLAMCLYGCQADDNKQQPDQKIPVKPVKTKSQKEQKKIERKKPTVAIRYHLTDGKKWMAAHKKDSDLLHLIATINRTDIDHLNKGKILLPNNSSADRAYFMPFPLSVSSTRDIDKIIFFSYPTQSFGAYQNGDLVYTGATNMGRKNNPTPTGLFFTNWKAEETTSTFDDEWILRWNFNIENKLGIGWHQYAMPGYPASHSCMRLQQQDAEHLYTWANQWVINKDTVTFKGTPVVIFGSYNFDNARPWLKLKKDPHALDISEKEMNEIVEPYLPAIRTEQLKKQQAIVKNE